MIIKAGFIQFEPELGKQDKNIHQLSILLSKAGKADLIVLPELANSGYNFESRDQAFLLAEKIGNSKYIEFLIDTAQAGNTFIVSGFLEKDEQLIYNTSVLVGPKGLIGKYRKIHLFMNEFDIFEKGDLGLPVFDIGICKIGMLICFDWTFPEVWRILALKGAELICHPSNLVLPFAQQAVPVHGMINKTFNITANRYGTEREVSFSGQSIISDPLGKTLYKASAYKDEIKIIGLDIQKSRNKQITARNHTFNDRRPEMYKEIID